ncbi:MAG: porin [Rhodospirillaceae bacterium]|nr:MAG: porin [Rhodospirillaceae bacterium]
MKTALKTIFLSSAFAVASSAAGYAQTADQSPAPAAATPAPQGLKLSGYIDGSITANPDSPSDRENFGQPFTDRSNRPILNQISLAAEKDIDSSKDYDFGFRVQGIYGSDARLTHFLGMFDQPNSKLRNQFDVLEGDVSVHTPWLGAGGTDFKVGMYPTPVGYEVMDPNGNPFASHSYIYAFGLPLKHTGVYATTHVNATWDVYYGVDTGANTTFASVGDENGAASYLFGFGLNGLMGGKVSVLALSHIGPEDSRITYPTQADSIFRYYNDVYVTTKVTDALTLVSDFNWAREDNGPGVSPANAYGFAQYASYSMSDTLAANARAEIYRDAEGFFVAKFPGNDDFVLLEKGLPNGSVGYGPATYGELTLGVTWKPAVFAPLAGLTIRPELRYDGTLSGGKPYDNGTKSSQFTAAVDAIVKF